MKPNPMNWIERRISVATYRRTPAWGCLQYRLRTGTEGQNRVINSDYIKSAM